jgi:hypothetical protein
MHPPLSDQPQLESTVIMPATSMDPQLVPVWGYEDAQVMVPWARPGLAKTTSRRAGKKRRKNFMAILLWESQGFRNQKWPLSLKSEKMPAPGP